MAFGLVVSVLVGQVDEGTAELTVWFAPVGVRICQWLARLAGRGLTDRNADCPSGYLGLVVAGSGARTWSSWARELMSSLAKTLPSGTGPCGR
jgi:hypothetical protein